MPFSFSFTALHPHIYCHLQNHLIFFLRATSHLHPLLALSHPPSFLCPALHCHCAHRGCDISATSPPPHFTHLPPLPFLRALGCTVPVNRWVVVQALSVCIDVYLSDKWSKIFLRWWVPTSACGLKICFSNTSQCVMRSGVRSAWSLCRTILPAHIAITSAHRLSELVTPLMLSVPCLLWPQHVNAHILHHSPSTTWHSISNRSHRQQRGEKWQKLYPLFQAHNPLPKNTHTNIYSRRFICRCSIHEYLHYYHSFSTQQSFPHLHCWWHKSTTYAY